MTPSATNVRIAPSLLSADFTDLKRAIEESERAGVDAFHLDVMDGHFVPNISFGPALVAAVRRRTNLPLDVHLMVERPERFVRAFQAAGGNRMTFHAEATDDIRELARSIRRMGCEAGVALRPETPLDRIDPYASEIDAILMMTVNPGFSGQRFMPEVLAKIETARTMLDREDGSVDLGVDGGISEETGAKAARAGATFFVCGNAAFLNGEIERNLRGLREAIERGAGERHALR